MSIEILKYSDDEMYFENDGIFKLQQDGYLEFENPIAGILRAGGYKIIPSESDNSVGVVHIPTNIGF